MSSKHNKSNISTQITQATQSTLQTNKISRPTIRPHFPCSDCGKNVTLNYHQNNSQIFWEHENLLSNCPSTNTSILFLRKYLSCLLKEKFPIESLSTCANCFEEYKKPIPTEN